MASSQHPSARGADPCRVADVVLAAAVRAQADAVYLEPVSSGDESYVITLERSTTVLTTLTLDAQLGAAVIARLAFLADLDLATPSASTAVLPVRAGDRAADVAITLRPGANLRADLMVTAHGRGRGAPIPAVDPGAGDVIGSYRVLALLGEGGMGTVYQVEHVGHGRRCALKVLRAQVVAREEEAAQRFLREARTAARIHHPHIVEVFDAGYLPDGRPYFVMELLEGESLARRVARGALPIDQVVTVARQLAMALGAAHDRGVIHTDVTPSNVIVLGTAALHVKLVDFGLAELLGAPLDDEHPEHVLGTPAYISPEQLRGLAATDRSDQYGLGAVLFELVVGHPPFQHADLRTLCMMHLSTPVPPVESPHGPLPPKLADAITTLLQKTPHHRFPSMAALLATLDEIEKVTDRRGWRRWLSS